MPRQKHKESVLIKMAVKDNKKNRVQPRMNDDVVAEGVWLTADSIQHLIYNQHQGGKAMNETVWKCDQLRAGQLYNRMMFDTQAEAKKFVSRMRQMEPDQTFSIEAIEASRVWN
jgi:hypothetical protein